MQMLETIKTMSDNTNDSDLLDHVLCLLTQASAALKTVKQSLPENEKELSSFEVKETFAPAQKMKYSCDFGKLLKIPEGNQYIHH